VPESNTRIYRRAFPDGPQPQPFFKLDNREGDDTGGHDPGPGPKVDGRALEQSVHHRQVGVTDLDKQHNRHPAEQPRI